MTTFIMHRIQCLVPQWAVKTQMSSAFTKTLPSYPGERTHHYMTTEHWLKTTNQQRQVLFKLVSRKAKDKTGIWNLRGPRSLPPFLRWRAVVKIKRQQWKPSGEKHLMLNKYKAWPTSQLSSRIVHLFNT